MKKSLLNILRKIVLITLGILLAILFGEILIRIFRPYNTVTFFNSSYTFNCFKPGDFYWISFKQNKDCILKSNVNAFPDVSIKTNSLGLRGENIAIPKPAETKRLLFLGDSFTVGWGIPENQTFPSLTSKLLKQNLPNKNIDFINAGITGSGPSYYYLFLKNHPELDADIVIIGFYIYNDVTGVRDSSWIETDQQGLPKKVISTTSYIDSAGVLRRTSVPLLYRLPLLRDSQLFGIVADNFLKPNIQIFDKEIVDLICFFRSKCHKLDPIIEKERQLLLSIKQLTDSRGQKLLFVIIPGEYQVYPNTKFKYGIPVSSSMDDKAFPNKRLSDFLSQQNINYLDLLPVFRDHIDEPAYFAHDDHFNSLGHQFAANAISEKLKESLK